MKLYFLLTKTTDHNLQGSLALASLSAAQGTSTLRGVLYQNWRKHLATSKPLAVSEHAPQKWAPHKEVIVHTQNLTVHLLTI